MARTKASVGAKVAFGKSSKAQKVVVQQSSSKSGKRSKPSWLGGNSYCPRETPRWQLPITKFFPDVPNTVKPVSYTTQNDNDEMNSATENNNSIQTVKDEEELQPEFEESESDITVTSENELLPLDDDPSSHKIGDYFQPVNKNLNNNNEWGVKTVKNKGKGKTSKNKEESTEKDSPMEVYIENKGEKENVEPKCSVNNVKTFQKRNNDEFIEDNEEVTSFKRIKIA